MSDFWNTRYASDAYAYGEQPNAFFKSVIDSLPPGRILVPGAGEGRDAVYAATLGWKVVAFDLSTEGRRKAIQLAQRHKVQINYHIMDAADVAANKKTAIFDAATDGAPSAEVKHDTASDAANRFDPGLPHPAYDLIALVFLHLSLPLREDFHRGMVKLLQPGGMLIMEAFTPGQLAYTSGGPKDPHMLYTPEDMAKDFEGLRLIENHELVIELNEGSFHQGAACVMRLRGEKEHATCIYAKPA